LYKVSSKWNNL